MKAMINRLRRQALTTVLILLLILSPLFSQEKFRRNPPYPEPVSGLNLPPVDSEILNNGLKVLTITRPNSQIFNLQILIQAGESYSPPHLPGLATLTARMLQRGTLTLSPFEIIERLETLGIEYSIEVQADYTIFSYSFLEEHLDSALSLVSLFFIEPAFPAIELTSAKRELYYQLLNHNQDPEKAAYAFFTKKIFSGSGYNPGVLDEELLKNISQKDLAFFHQSWLRPNNSTIILNGNISLSNASQKISQKFRRWAPRALDRKPVSRLENRTFNQICFLDHPSSEIAVITGNFVVPPSDEDYFPLLVLNHILGGTTNSRLFLGLRESKGLAYYAFSELSFFKENGLFWIRAKTSPEATSQVVKEINELLTNLVENRINPSELERAKAYLIGNLPLQIQTPAELSKKIGLLEIFNLPLDFWSKYYQNIMLVNTERVQGVARSYLTKKPLMIIAGDLNRTLNHLREFDQIEIYNRKGQFQAIFQKGVLKYENR
ncbi:MAG: pitrilysin family protein [Acidobacteriota bacterium]|nr:pitrilysin family protein [Acidobacteriota bacterium]MDW3228586.1 pitrilysin family protein [Acidobacteriota bacterium]